ncbi:hypothetical protein [Advenella sp. S44]|uniref:hypothetical protein n=1 Tax=Advenella sp. S44 TaxID=1982755 RepID=UPI0012906A63|nr:hypothetical protein [Advenella sp. S44]
MHSRPDPKEHVTSRWGHTPFPSMLRARIGLRFKGGRTQTLTMPGKARLQARREVVKEKADMLLTQVRGEPE